MPHYWIYSGVFYLLPNPEKERIGDRVLIVLTYKEAKELNEYLKSWERVRSRSEHGEIHFDADKLEYNKTKDEVKIELLP